MRRILELVLTAALVGAPLAASAGAETEADRLATLLALKPGMRVAEIGAGDGTLAVEIARRVGPSGRVYATELGDEERDAIRARARSAGVANLEVIEAQLAATGLPERCCDALFLRDVWHHLSDPAAIARDIRRALVPGGRLVVIDFPPTWYLRPWTPSGVGPERAGHGIAPEAALRELEAAGFTRDKVIPTWTTRWFAADVYALVLKSP